MSVTDPLARLPAGSKISFEPIPFGGSDASSVPEGVTNWTFFDGALMIVLLTYIGEPPIAIGTAVGIAPGLAVTATHVVEGDLAKLLDGDASILCAAPRDSGLELWSVRKVMGTDTDDTAYLGLELASEVSDGWKMRTLPVTTRTPRIGERLHVAGFRLAASQAQDGHLTLEGDLYMAVGEVSAVHHPMRDRHLMPYPAIEIACGSLGAMSGGAVLDESGHLMGVISRGVTTDDGRGPTFASWVVGVLNRTVELPWPPGAYPQPVHLLDIDERLLNLEGRDHLEVIDESRCNYRAWFDREG